MQSSYHKCDNSIEKQQYYCKCDKLKVAEYVVTCSRFKTTYRPLLLPPKLLLLISLLPLSILSGELLFNEIINKMETAL